MVSLLDWAGAPAGHSWAQWIPEGSLTEVGQGLKERNVPCERGGALGTESPCLRVLAE